MNKTAPRSSGLWVPEQIISGPVSEWFLEIAPIAMSSKDWFWEECNSNMKGLLRCYMSSEDKNIEWWGFTDRNDVMWFLLRWG
jgi:hypothetical protein